MGYTKPIKRTDIKVLGKQALGMMYVGADSMLAGGYISEHDKKIANKIAKKIKPITISNLKPFESFFDEILLMNLKRK